MDDSMSTKQAAGHLQVSPSAVRRLARTGALPGVKGRRGWRFRRADVDKFVAEMAVDQELAEEAQRRFAAATEDDFVAWEDVKSESAALP